jgi:hypothetical protein
LLRVWTRPAKSCRAVKALDWAIGLPFTILPRAEKDQTAVTDIFREVEEEVRRERLENIWKEYGDYIVAAAALLILAAAGFRLWTYYEARERARASDEYLAAEQLMESGQSRAAAQTFARLGQNAPGGYAKLAQLQGANALSSSGNTAEALAIYRKLASDNDEMISSIARLRAAWIVVEGAPKSEVESLIGPLAGETSPWKPVAREILAYADYHAGAIKQAQAEFDALAKDGKSPSGVRGRSRAMAIFLAAGAGQNVGNVPMPQVPPSSAAPGQPGALTGGSSGAVSKNANASTAAPAKPGASPPVTIETNVAPANGKQSAPRNPPKGQPPK